jgi:hypothetical protein
MELIIESTFLSELLQEAWFGRGQNVDVIHSSVDAFGYDLVLQLGDVTRHVQLKAKRQGGSTTKYAINTLLTAQPAGCVICIIWTQRPETHRLQLEYRWFGNGSKEQLDGLGDQVSKHSRGNAQGVKPERVRMRDVKLSSFDEPCSMPALLDKLFGPTEA